MSYIVKETDIVKDKDTLLNLLRRNRQRKNFPYEKRYDWLYRNNPYGKAIAWIIWDEKQGYPAGFTAVYPRKILLHNKPYLCWNCGDFSIDPKYRSLGVAVQLRKAAKEQVDRGKVPFLYAHPNDRMVHIHLRAGHQKIAQMKRFALPIGISKYVSGSPVGKKIAPALDSLLSNFLKIKFKALGDYENLNQSRMAFGESYLKICEQIALQRPVVGVRDQEFLNWKYKNHPVYSYQLYNYYENGKLVGFIIYHLTEQTLHMVEVVCPDESQVQKNLLSTFINFTIRTCSQISVISTVVQEFNPIIPRLMEAGFKYRDDATSDVIAYAVQPEIREVIHNGKNWFMNTGDRDA